jgi:threonyl-tRNA synthetase
MSQKNTGNANSENIRHSCAHLLAAAVLKLYPDTKLTIGPAIENGFYYDLEFKNQITEEELPKIENEMRKILPTFKDFSKREVTVTEAEEIYKNNPYKLELIEEIVKRGEPITLYKAGGFEDLCRGGHAENPAEEIGVIKLLSLAGAYWRGDEKNKMLTRIYGTCFPTQKELDDYLNLLEEAKKRDHKKLGPALELFFFHETSPGMPYWLPKGMIIYNELLKFSREVQKSFGYLEIAAPVLNKKELYETSGHWQHYRDDMFISPMSYIRNDSKEILEGAEVFGIKPMNCPNAMNIFSMKTRSWKELPLRFSEYTALHRFEPSGTLNGLFRAREFHQDDAHIFITGAAQLKDQFQELMKIVDTLYSAFGLSYRLRFGTMPEDHMGEKKEWEVAEESLQKVLDASGKEYVREEGEGAFYGPKIDILMKDSIGREWQTGTIQLDFQQPKNFKLTFADSDGALIMPYVIHRAIYGSFERFIGILTEHYMGAFPLWLSPVQIALLPITDGQNNYCNEVAEKLRKEVIRVEVDSRNERLQAKIRDATLQKVPYLGIIGKQEVESNSVSLRLRDGKDLGKIKLEDLTIRLKQEIDKKI